MGKNKYTLGEVSTWKEKDLATPVLWARRTYVPRESKFSASSSPGESLAGTKSFLRPRLASLDTWMLLFCSREFTMTGYSTTLGQ